MSKQEGIKWEDPPPPPSNSGRWVPILEELKKKPGKWARIHVVQGEGALEKAAALASNLRLGRVMMPTGKFQAVHRRMQSGNVGIWARFIEE